METRTIRVADRGYLVLPAKLRRKYNIKKGTRLLLREEADEIILKPIPSFTDRLAGLTKGAFGQTGDEIQKWLDREREER